MKKLLLLFLILLVINIPIQAQTLWGVTFYGGAYNEGTIFSYNILTGRLTDVHDFGPDTLGGLYPTGSLIQASDGLLYGNTYYGGVNRGGTIFSYNISTGQYSVVYSIDVDTEAAYPIGALIQASNGLLYGTTDYGISGNIYSYDILTDTFTVVHNFSDTAISTDGATPYDGLLQASNGLLYGTTAQGGADGSGAIFSFNDTTGQETVVHNFSQYNNAGSVPYCSLIQAKNGLLYGMTLGGGPSNYDGTIFTYNCLTDSTTDIYNFGTGAVDGASPWGSLIQAGNGLLYGMNQAGGYYGNGTIFSYDITKDSEKILHSFGNGTDGFQPYGALIQASNGLLYGMTYRGGTNDTGMIFSYDISNGNYIDIHDFTGPDGDRPNGSLIEVDTPAGINQLTVESGQLTVYPNPTSDFIHTSIQLKQNDNLQLHLVNMFGQTVWSADAVNVNSYQNGVSVADLAGGVYLLEMVTGGGMETKEVVVAK